MVDDQPAVLDPVIPRRSTCAGPLAGPHHYDHRYQMQPQHESTGIPGLQGSSTQRTDSSRGHQGCRAFRGLVGAGQENPRVDGMQSNRDAGLRWWSTWAQYLVLLCASASVPHGLRSCTFLAMGLSTHRTSPEALKPQQDLRQGLLLPRISVAHRPGDPPGGPDKEWTPVDRSVLRRFHCFWLLQAATPTPPSSLLALVHPHPPPKKKPSGFSTSNLHHRNQ